MLDDLDFPDQIELRNWRHRAVNWASVVGLLHGCIGIIACIAVLVLGNLRAVGVPSVIFLAPAAIHIIAAVGIARSYRWAWRLEAVFAWTHVTIVALLAGFLLYGALLDDAPVIALTIAFLLGLMGVAPLARLVYCLHCCRNFRWHSEINRPAFEVISRGSAE